MSDRSTGLVEWKSLLPVGEREGMKRWFQSWPSVELGDEAGVGIVGGGPHGLRSRWWHLEEYFLSTPSGDIARPIERQMAEIQRLAPSPALPILTD